MKLSKLKPISGIYKITNLENGKIYIGQSANIPLRWASHVDQLIGGKHVNKNLLNDFQEYGLHVFSAEIIEKCDSSDKVYLLERERYYIAQYCQSGFKLYNKIEDGSGGIYTFVTNGGKRARYDHELHRDKIDD